MKKQLQAENKGIQPNNTTYESFNDSLNNNNLIDITPNKRHFIILYDSVYTNNNLTSNEIKLIIKLLSSAPTFKPSHRKLSQIMKINNRALIKAVNGLKEKGYLVITKNGKNSEWQITQEPSINKVSDLTAESLSQALINFDITPKELKQMHRLKYIDDLIYIESMKLYSKKLNEIIKTKWL